MEFVIDDPYLPAILTAPPMSDEEFVSFCAGYPDYFFEMNADGDLIVMPPQFSWLGLRNSAINAALATWARCDLRGITCDSSSGFVLPNGARRSPDCSWTLKSRLAALDPVSRKTFWRLCPNFVIELRSSWDRLRLLEEKMKEYISNGAQLGWLIDPDARSVSIY